MLMMGVLQSGAVLIAAMAEGGASEGWAAGVLKTSYMTCGGSGAFAAMTLAKASASAMLVRGVPATVMPRKCASVFRKVARYFVSSGFRA
ncbi:hypothetical protein E2562_025113 [Oryza meyeriana var. granulata]|uniref:CASP-like protein n=1 Tax=Oryza meyeriana var. granulata TaxID=110450 RepID=A0A6G1CH92_9ORYZ|nr:hypothetical protein E2562_025113 [Oryza meyeriana var. granulata]